MADVQTIAGDVLIRGGLRVLDELSVTAGNWDNDDINAAAGIAATKLEHQHSISYHQADGSDVVAAIVPVHVVYGSTATIVALEVACLDAPGSTDESFSVDLKMANQAAPSPVTVLTTPVTATTTDAQVLAGSIGTTALTDGDTLVIDVSTTGTGGGTQGQGLICTLTIREDAV